MSKKNENNNNNNLEQDLKSSQEKLNQIFVKNDLKKLKTELNQIFKLLIKSDISEFTKTSYSLLNNIINIIEKFIAKKKLEIDLVIIKEIYFLLSNIKSKELLLYIFSIQNNSFNDQEIKGNIFDNLISINDFNNKEEFLNLQVNLMKSLVIKLNSESINYFYKKEINFFPILNKCLLLHDHPDNMLRSAIHNTILLITKNKNESLNEYLTSFPVALYYVIIIFELKKIISELNFIFAKGKNVFEYFEEKHEDFYDKVLYINDILLCNIKNINFILINCLLNEIIFPLFNVIISKNKENISVINSIYVLSFFIYYIKNDYLINLISYFLISEKLPSVFFEKIEIYKFSSDDNELIDDINFFIKNINYADINDETWKRNSDFIKNDIGLDLYTGIKIKDNNFDYIINMMNDIKENKCNDIDFIENDILFCLCELLASQDENIILNTCILIYNIINYYKEYLKNNIKENDNSQKDKIIDMNKVKTAHFNTVSSSKYNYNDKSYINNTKILYNPFLYSFINFRKIKNNINNRNILRIIMNLLKIRNKFRIFTNELLLNTLFLLIKILCLENNIMTREAYNLIKEIKFILKEEINNIRGILNKESEIFNFNNINVIYKYYKNQTFDSKLLDTMKSYYILTIPFMHLEKNDKIPFTLLEEKSKENIFKGNMLNILILLDIIQQTNKSNKNDILFNFFEKENNSNNYEIGKIYNKSNIGNEYGFCFIGYNYDDFKFNVQSIKKCLFIFSDLYFYLGEIISKTFKNITDIKIINSIPIMSLNISISLIENNFLEIKDNRNNNKLIMNCFDDDNKKKVYNYFAFMINNNIEFEKNEINLFFKNVENKIFK